MGIPYNPHLRNTLLENPAPRLLLPLLLNSQNRGTVLLVMIPEMVIVDI